MSLNLRRTDHPGIPSQPVPHTPIVFLNSLVQSPLYTCPALAFHSLWSRVQSRVHVRLSLAQGCDLSLRKEDSDTIVQPSGSIHLRPEACSFGAPDLTATQVSTLG